MQPRRRALILLGLFTIALILRLVALGSEPLWVDEFYTHSFATSGSLIDVLTYAEYSDPHPPLYYGLIHLWLELVPATPFTMRVPTAVLGSLAAPLAYLVGDRLSGRRTAVYAGILFVVSPRFVYHSQQARMYGLMLAVFTFALYALVRHLQDGSRRSLAFVIAATVLAGYSHLYGMFVIITMNIIVAAAVYFDWSVHQADVSITNWVGGQSAALLALLPWVGLILSKIVARSEQAEWLVAPAPVAPIFTLFHWGTYSRSGHIVRPEIVSANPNVLLALPLAVILLFFFISDRTETDTILVVWMGVPLLLSLILSYLVQPIYLNRYFVQFGVGLMLLVAVRASVGVPDVNVGAVLFAVLIVTSAPSLAFLYTVDENPPQKTVIAEINEQAGPVIAESTHVAVGYEYYGSNELIFLPQTTTAVEAQEQIPDGEFWVYSLSTDLDYLHIYNESHRPVKRIDRGRLTAIRYEPVDKGDEQPI